MLEEALIKALADFGIRAGRNPQHRGVWVSHRKVAALGVAIRRWVSFHGIALNVSPSMDHFCYINPCALGSDQVTSMSDLLGETPTMKEVAQRVVAKFIELFPGKWGEISPTELFTEVRQENVSARAVIKPAPTTLSK